MDEYVVNQTNNSRKSTYKLRTYFVTRNVLLWKKFQLGSTETEMAKGVIKLVRMADSGENRICQKPELASNLVKTFTLASCASV